MICLHYGQIYEYYYNLFSLKGIYKIVEDKRNDTVYIDEDMNTEDVKIPDPVVKTGYIGE